MYMVDIQGDISISNNLAHRDRDTYRVYFAIHLFFSPLLHGAGGEGITGVIVSGASATSVQ